MCIEMSSSNIKMGVTFAHFWHWQEQYLLAEETGIEKGGEATKAVFELMELKNGFTKKVYQVTNSSTSEANNVSLYIYIYHIQKLMNNNSCMPTLIYTFNMWIEGGGDTVSVEEFSNYVCWVFDGLSWHDWERSEGSDVHWKLAHYGHVPVSFPKHKANLSHKLLAVFLSW